MRVIWEGTSLQLAPHWSRAENWDWDLQAL